MQVEVHLIRQIKFYNSEIKLIFRFYIMLKLTLTLCVITLAIATKFSSKYHTTSELNDELESLSRSCSFLTLNNASDSPLIKEISINKN